MKIQHRLRLSENKFKRRYEFCPSEGAIASRLVLGTAQPDSYFSFFYHYSIFLNSVFTRTDKYRNFVCALLFSKIKCSKMPVVFLSLITVWLS